MLILKLLWSLLIYKYECGGSVGEEDKGGHEDVA